MIKFYWSRGVEMKKSILNLNSDVEKNLKNISFHVLEAMSDLVRVIDSKGQVIFTNSAMDKLLGYDSIGDNIFYDEKANPKTISRSTFLTKNTFVDEATIGEKYYSVKSSPVFDDVGKMVAAVEVYRDITAQTMIRNELFKANKKMTDDIRFSKLIQMSILPRIKSIGDFEFDYAYLPSDGLSGDIFDIIKIDNNRVGIYIADVVGHGVSASIMTMFIRQTMRSILEEAKKLRPSEVLVDLKKRFDELSLADNQYFTIFYLLIDLEKKKIVYANGGHNCEPLLISGENKEFLKAKGKFISSIFKNERYEEHERYISRGEELLFYTDGVIETKNIEGKMFGSEGLLNVGKEQKRFVDDILKKLKEYRWGEQVDDLALLHIKRRKEC